MKKWATKKILLCPACGKPYEYCHGKVKMPYFRHMDKSQCEDLFFEPETEEHKTGKRDLYEWIKKQDGVTDAILEGWIPDTKQRPDIMFKYNGKLHVIEFQCSPISSEYIERHNLYRTADVIDIWICGTEKYLGGNKKLNTLEKDVGIYYNTKNKLIFQTDNISVKDIDEIQKIESLRGRLNTPYKRRRYFNRAFHVMLNPYDYLKGYKNYLLIKNISNSYSCIGAYYPSPTGRPSNKYPYPVREYAYTKNHSYATCYNLNSTKLQNIMEARE